MNQPPEQQPPAAATLPFTGERFTPECVREIWYEHWHRYALARGLVAGRKVLDLACGEGYGSAILAESAAQVVGIDSDEQTIAHAANRYHGANLAYKAGTATTIPAGDGEFGAIVSFETIEHLAEQASMLDEFSRVLAEDGFLVISSPDKAQYSDATGYQNEFHVRELYREEFLALLAPRFGAVRLLGQAMMFHSCIWDLGHTGPTTEYLLADGAEVLAAPSPAAPPLYFVALCARDAASLPLPPALSLFTDRSASVYAHYQHEIRKNMAAGAVLAERDAEIERLKGLLAQGTSSGL